MYVYMQSLEVLLLFGFGKLNFYVYRFESNTDTLNLFITHTIE